MQNPEQKITLKITHQSDGIVIKQLTGRYIGPVKLLQLIAAAAALNPQSIIDQEIVNVYTKP